MQTSIFIKKITLKCHNYCDELNLLIGKVYNIYECYKLYLLI